MKLLTLFFFAGAVGPLPSVFLYVLLPGGTVLFFNGQPSDTANFWCSVTAAADAVASFLCASALVTKINEVKILVVRSMAIYSVFHFGAFWYWSNHGDRHPAELANGYPFAILTALAAAMWWGWLRPPTDGDDDDYRVMMMQDNNNNNNARTSAAREID